MIDANLILDNIKQCVYIKDREGIYIYANAAFAAAAGMEAIDILGKSDYDLTWHNQADYFRDDDANVLSGANLINVERFQTRKGGLKKIILSLQPYYLCEELVGVLGNFFDCESHLLLETKGIFDNNKLFLEFVPEWLSAAEIRICFYLLHGFSASRISGKTGTAVSTVRYHIENIKTKMQCDSKNEIAETAIRTGVAWKIFSLQHYLTEESGN